MLPVEVIEQGEGTPVVLVDGDVFARQWRGRPSNRWAAGHLLRMVNRRGFGCSPEVDGEDFDVDAADVAAVLGAGAHLVGPSYGAVAALLAAARRPEAVLSLAVVEPPAFGLTRHRPDTAAFIRQVENILRTDPTPEQFLPQFIRAVGGDPGRLPTPLPPPVVRAAAVQMHGRWPWEATIPLDDLARGTYPKLVISGGHSAIFDAACDVLEQRLPAARAVIVGAGHAVPVTGQPFNEQLTQLWSRAEDAAPRPVS